jgi:hypothetical protein
MSTKVDNILLIEGSKESVAEAAKLFLFRSHAYPIGLLISIELYLYPKISRLTLPKRESRHGAAVFPHVPPKPLSHKERVLLKSAF